MKKIKLQSVETQKHYKKKNGQEAPYRSITPFDGTANVVAGSQRLKVIELVSHCYSPPIICTIYVSISRKSSAATKYHICYYSNKTPFSPFSTILRKREKKKKKKKENKIQGQIKRGGWEKKKKKKAPCISTTDIHKLLLSLRRDHLFNRIFYSLGFSTPTSLKNSSRIA
jgi:hypothetical protein